MPRQRSDRVGVLVLRVWVEYEPPHFRARIVQSLDIVSGSEEVAVVSDPDAAVAEVAAWLQRFLNRGDGPVTRA